MSLEFRRATPEDVDTIGSLLRTSFPDNPKADPDVFRWQYLEVPWGDPILWLAELDGVPVGTCTAFVQPGLVDGVRTPVVKVADAAVDPAARGRGIFATFLGHLTRDMVDRGIPLCLSHPANPASRIPQERLGMRAVASPVPVHVAAMDPDRLAERFGVVARLGAPIVRAWLRGPRGDDLDVRGVPRAPDDVDDLWDRHRPSHGIDHDATWWTWRYARPATTYAHVEARRHGRLVGLAVGTVRRILDAPFVHVLDVVADDADAARGVLSGLAEALPDAAGIAGIALRGTDVAAHLGAARMVRVPARLAPAFTFGVRPADPSTGSVERAPWRLTWCDLDHV